MADNITIARPYAKAVFADAKTAGLITDWSLILQTLAKVVEDHAVKQLMMDPRVSRQALESLLIRLMSAAAGNALEKVGDKFSHFIRLLMAEKRLQLLPNIANLYEKLVLANAHVVEAEVISAFPLGDDHRRSIENALEKRFNSKIQLKISKDESLIGGALVRAGNWVIDGSIKGKLAKLAEGLMG